MSKRLMFQCKVKSSSVADKNGKTMVTTAISGRWYEGMMSDFNPALEEIFSGHDCWKSLNADQGGTWNMTVSDANTGTVLGNIKPCAVKNINGTRVEDGIIMGLKMEHPLTPVQEALEKTILTDINVELTVDMTVFEDQPEGEDGVPEPPPEEEREDYDNTAPEEESEPEPSKGSETSSSAGGDSFDPVPGEV